ncbi:Sec1-like protein [Saitoella complicata NRRL Y-17804]|uniref:Sec1-like protein n=1 Tax=Saitoella complicata (strain BCRC 22490 / CBS 7301 / JCM 7358 / NBRC 10748 / NRRL Y-17804) TaxID=698492 RepID=UPI000866BEF8|nr:Sec1-like protein [Saitoella complicata NRRL Y-17804]ODQ55580.1 Sec1-like protein [Saitoella complicata NRRL Y-17804]
MDVIKAVQNYVNKMIADTSGMKALLLDVDTTQIISMVTTQSTLLSQEVFLTDRLENAEREKMRHLKCICFVRPTPESIQHFIDELRAPKYGEYYLYFSNIIKKSSLERLAESDEYEMVKSVQEFFADYLAINPDLLSLNIHPPQYTLFSDSPSTWSPPSLVRSTEGLVSLLLSLKKKPVVRYEKNSAMGKKLAQEVQYVMGQESPLFEFRRGETQPLLLILDRKNDPVTPLLTQWTYQAMVHELLGISNGRVTLPPSADNPKGTEVVLSTSGTLDPFFASNMYENFGDLGANIKEYVDTYQSKAKTNKSIESIADMKRFVEEYPEFRRLSGNVSKHVSLVSELSRRVEGDNLLETSELEQSLACNDNHTADLRSVQRLIQQPIPDASKIRLVALYALRYESNPSSALPTLLSLLSNAGIPSHQVATISRLLQYAGQRERQEDLFGGTGFLGRARSGMKGLKGVENVYTQHTPRLSETLTSLLRSRLPTTTHPYISDPPSQQRVQDVLVFFVGGVTYAEAMVVNKFNASQEAMKAGVRVVLGGTTVCNSGSFVEEVRVGGERWARTTAGGRLGATGGADLR